MKYSNTGTAGFLQQIGIAGSPYLTGTTLWELADVGVDSGGNIWVVDDGATHIAKFNSAGVFQGEFLDVDYGQWVQTTPISYIRLALPSMPLAISTSVMARLGLSCQRRQRSDTGFQ